MAMAMAMARPAVEHSRISVPAQGMSASKGLDSCSNSAHLKLRLRSHPHHKSLPYQAKPHLGGQADFLVEVKIADPGGIFPQQASGIEARAGFKRKLGLPIQRERNGVAVRQIEAVLDR